MKLKLTAYINYVFTLTNFNEMSIAKLIIAHDIIYDNIKLCLFAIKIITQTLKMVRGKL